MVELSLLNYLEEVEHEFGWLELRRTTRTRGWPKVEMRAAIVLEVGGPWLSEKACWTRIEVLVLAKEVDHSVPCIG